MSEEHNREVNVLNEALELPSGERASYLDQACAGDSALRARVEDLLKAHSLAAGFLDLPPAGRDLQRTVRTNPAPTEGPGDKIGRYKLLQQIGEGGCGVVYMADQEEPVQRRVALKVIKLGMDTRQVIARFDAERQALARMDHPNIAHVLNAGATETGRPYFVMELVRGIKITDYCDDNKIPTGERLELFIQVCGAIQHAHQKGIIHRDIKPSNILVSLNDGVAVPKVIDFGIAKATQGRLTDHTLFTAFEQFIGTPAYMSPEQAVMTSLDIDTRSDIYSLGVLLYELLTGRTPFDQAELLAAGLDEMRRTIRDKEPPKPSTRLRTMLEVELSTTAEHRKTEPPKLINLLRGDMDWIVMKCLEKGRARRYETASGLAADIQRHLDSEPVTARPPSASDRVHKAVRRHKVGVAMAGAISLALIGGLIVSLVGFAQARRERDHAQAARAEAVEQKLRADQGAAEIHRRLVLQYLSDGNRLMEAGDWLNALPWFSRALEVDQSDPGRAAMHRLRLDTILQRSPKLVAVCFLDKAINNSEFNRDGSRFLTACTDGTARVWDSLSGQPVTPPLTHSSSLYSAHFSPDGNWVVTASKDGTAQVWDSTTGARRGPPLPHKQDVRAAVFSPDGRWVATGCADSTVRIWNAATGEPIGQPLLHSRPPRSVAFNPDGTRLLAVSSGGVSLWDVAADGQAKLIHTWNGDFGVFSPDGLRVALIYLNTLQVQEVATIKMLFSASVNTGTRGLAYSADGGKLLSYGDANQVWDANTGAPLTVTLRPPGITFSGSFRPDGRWVVTAGGDKTVRLWDPGTAEQVAVPLPHGDRVRNASFSPDGSRILTCTDDGVARIWDLAGGEFTSPPVVHPNLVHRILFHPDSRRALTISLDGTAIYWDLATGAAIPSVLTNLSMVTAAEFSADGQRVALGYSSGEARIWNLKSGAAASPPLAGQSPISDVEFSPEGLRLVSAARNGAICIWDLRTGSLIARMQSSQPVSHATFTPDGKKVITAIVNAREEFIRGASTATYTAKEMHGSNAVVQLWDAATGKPEGSPFTIPGVVSQVSFSPDRRYLTGACSDEAAVGRLSQTFVWDTASGKAVSPALTHPQTVVDSAFSPDGKNVATGGADGTVRIWDAVTGRRVGNSLNSGNGARVMFSPDGRIVATAGSGAVRLWDAHTGESLGPGFKTGNQVALNLAAFSPDGQYLVLASGDNCAQSWKLPKSDPPLEDELRRAQLIASARVDEQEAEARLGKAQMKTAWDDLRAKYPSDFAVTPEQSRAWRHRITEADVSSAQQLVHAGSWGTARHVVVRIRTVDEFPEAAAVLTDVINLGEMLDAARAKGGLKPNLPTEVSRTAVDRLNNGYPSPLQHAAEYHLAQGRAGEAEKFFEDVIALQKRNLGESAAEVGLSFKSYADFLIYQEQKPAEALAQFLKALPIVRAWPDSGGGQLFWTLCGIGSALNAMGDGTKAEPYCREALENSRTHRVDEKSREPFALNALAESLAIQKRFAEAEPLLREQLALREAALGVGSDDYHWGFASLVKVLNSQNQPDKIEALYRDALAKLRPASSNDTVAIAVMSYELGDLLAGWNKTNEAALLHQQALDTLPRLRPEDLLKRTWMANRLAQLLASQGRLEDAEKLYESLIEYQVARNGESSPITAELRHNYGEMLQANHKPGPALEQLMKALPVFRETGNANLAWLLRSLGCALMELDKRKEAEPYLQESLALERKRGLPEGIGYSLQALAWDLAALERLPEAEILFREAVPLWVKCKGKGSAEYIETLRGLNDVLRRLGKPAMAAASRSDLH